MRLQKLKAQDVAQLGLSSETTDFLTNNGLPVELHELEGSIELTFYPDKERIVKKDFRGTNYVIIGDDSGTRLAISLVDNCVYSIDLDNVVPADPICFVNSGIDRFVESIRHFIDFKAKAERREQPEFLLIELLKQRIMDIDKRALDPGTWWTQIIDDPISN